MVNLLVAFPYWSPKTARVLREFDSAKYRLLIDSGAFSAYTVGKAVDLDDYCRFLDSIRQFPAEAIQLDVIGDPEASLRNYQVMRARGYEVAPVFTRGSPLELLDEFERGRLLLLGGVARGAGNAGYVKWFSEALAARGDPFPTHWLGFTRVPFILRYRPRSVDSSSWCSGRFGQVSFYVGEGQIVTLTKAEARDMGPSLFQAAISSGAEPWQVWALQKQEAWTNTPVVRDWRRERGPGQVGAYLSILAHLHRAADLEARTGTRLYLATTNDLEVAAIMAAAKTRGDI